MITSLATCPVKECSLSVDVILKSADGVLLGAHQRNLEQFSEGFPYADSTIVDEVAPLEERADILQLMLQFMHNSRQPDLTHLRFDSLSSLAEAVEKYMIYSAMEICRVHMTFVSSSSMSYIMDLNQQISHAAPKNPIGAFMYAAKHEYPALVSSTAPLTLELTASAFLFQAKKFGLSQSISFQWCKYRAHWTDIISEHVLRDPPSVIKHKGGRDTCENWPPFRCEVIDAIGRRLTDLVRFSDIVEEHRSELEGCIQCSKRADSWEYRVRQAVAELPTFAEV